MWEDISRLVRLVPSVRAVGVSSYPLVHPKGHHPSTNATVELSQLLGVDGTDSSGDQHVRGGTGCKVNSNINVQMIHILQSQRDAYRDKLSKVLYLLRCTPLR